MAKGMLLLQPVLQFLDNSGNVLSGGQLYFYAPSSTTPKNTYTDSTKDTANANPVILDSAGRPNNSNTPINIYLDGSYKLVVQDSLNNIIRVVDPVTTLGQLVSTTPISASTNVTELNRDQFLVVDASAGDITLTVAGVATLGDGFQFTVKKIDSSANTVTIQFNASETGDGQNSIVLTTQYQNQSFTCDGTQWLINSIVAPNLSAGTITATSVTSGHINIQNDTISTTDTDGTLVIAPNGTGNTEISAGNLNLILGALNETPPLTIASASTVAIGAALANTINITGTTAITAFDTVTAGIIRRCIFAAGIVLTYNATSLILPAAINITTQVGDIATFMSLGSGNWQCMNYTPFALRQLTAINYQTFGAGTAIYTPTPGMVACEVSALSGGGGGGGLAGGGGNGAAGGGGAGGYLEVFLTASQIGSSQSIVVGAGGAGGVAGANNGTSGNGTSMGILWSISGGSGGLGASTNSGATYTQGGAGGSVSVTTGTPILGVGGNTGGNGFALGQINGAVGGQGASTPKGTGGVAPGNTSPLSGGNAGLSGSGYGVGGSGAAGNTSNLAGGNGTDGVLIIKEYIAY